MSVIQVRERAVRYVVSLFAAVIVLASNAADTKPPRGPLGACILTEEQGADFASQCLIHGGTSVKCSNGKPKCCQKDSNGEVCVDHPSVLGKSRTPTAKALAPR